MAEEQQNLLQQQNQILDKVEKFFGFRPNLFKKFDTFPLGADIFGAFASQFVKRRPDHQLPLSQPEIEYLGMKSSEEYECNYLFSHHKALLEQLLKDDSNKIPEEKKAALDYFAHIIAKEPKKAGNDALLNKFKEAGFTDAQFKHALMVSGVFSVASRWCLANSICLEEDFDLIYNLKQ
ncbi:hypothetical protein TTHERM_00058950 (macronuclear) [Tetrahymena thermophila SB210]|uniref:Uncharacterized protein n=1 Tax=Tetrahymena thermophila (strain SB210) TaxID=312017 RepID=I7M0D8_TETTS|nr:hypothetical protein TTHERM_00058950 [Tetrahymena thermophila SB210]EAR87383.1 hypothetical protein TTHERM_00058950 [Tetrahymena thermophila SB210]|eukprot:XP_001007628.1 hypothetical protein TTHERM_00058950 [Tetrahymena thermophila SB210]